MGIDLRLLGPVRIERDGEELPQGPARRLAVLCVLALHPGNPVSREQLVAAVWGDDAPASATGNVYTYISGLRQGAGRDLLTSGGGTYRLDLPPESVDVFRFEQLRDSARQHRAAGADAAELTALEEALALWRGEALDGVPGPFAEAQRLRLGELRLASAERLAELLTAAGRAGEAADALGVLAAAYPHRESLRERLVAALRAAGRPTGAAAGVKRDEHTLIGREEEIDRLRRAVATTVAGRGLSLRVEGAPGLGKSALLAAALRGQEEAGCRIGWAVGDELSQRMPLGLLLECFESALTGDPTGRAVRDLFAVAADAGDDGGDDETVARAAAVVRRAAAREPLVLVADDLQWSDPLTLRVWAALREPATALPLLLVAGVRSGSVDAHRVPADEVIRVGPLDEQAAAALARAVAPAALTRRDLRRIVEDAGGSPYYLRQLAAQPAGEPSPGELAVQRAAVRVHLALFGEQTRQVLRAVAFLGAWALHPQGGGPVGCTLDRLATATGRDVGELALAVAPAVAAGVLGITGSRIVFRHRVLARTLREGTPAAIRVSLHRSFAERLAAAGAEPEEVVAQLLAGDVPLGAAVGTWLTEHAERLAGRDPAMAVTVLQRARVQYDLDPAQRLHLSAWLARLLLRQERDAAAVAEWVAARTSDPELAGEMRWVVARTYERRGELAAAAEVARTVLAERRAAGPWTGRLRKLLSRVEA